MSAPVMDKNISLPYTVRVPTSHKGGGVMDVLAKLRLLLDERGWSEYKLARQCGLSDPT